MSDETDAGATPQRSIEAGQAVHASTAPHVDVCPYLAVGDPCPNCTCGGAEAAKAKAENKAFLKALKDDSETEATNWMSVDSLIENLQRVKAENKNKKVRFVLSDATTSPRDNKFSLALTLLTIQDGRLVFHQGEDVPAIIGADKSDLVIYLKLVDGFEVTAKAAQIEYSLAATQKAVSGLPVCKRRSYATWRECCCLRRGRLLPQRA